MRASGVNLLASGAWVIETLGGIEKMALIISEAQTRKLIAMPQALKVVDKIFHDRAAGKFRSLPRRRLKGSQKQLNIMAAWQEDRDLICLRAYAAEANTITLYNGRSGQIQAIINMGYLSSLRTGAATGVAAQYLAPKNSKTLGVIGPGWQATFQVEAIANACAIQKIVVFGRTPKRRKEFIKQMSRRVEAEWTETSSVEEVERESDILVVSTDSSTPVTHGANLKDEVLVASIGANQAVKHEVSNDLIGRMDLIVTDDLPTAKGDSGDLIAACEAGITSWDKILPLEKIVGAGAPTPRPKRILFQSNGIADEDLGVGTYVLQQAKRKKIKVRQVTEI
jgi:ornithine cyclodeaminase/alanine dehydrogenase-like protein (mu-crystallin family)